MDAPLARAHGKCDVIRICGRDIESGIIDGLLCGSHGVLYKRVQKVCPIRAGIKIF
jgi:hypothetical protein